MATQKPSSAEEEYFTKEEDEKLQILRARLDHQRTQQAKEQGKNLHWMKCPKCGGDLKEVLFRTVKVDTCQSCQGVWLDEGELEMLAGSGRNFIKDIVSSFGGK
ncbi:MAG: zf-TFIIB domain-containing protein [Deltaproteobacteria bacterium]|nr:zf-TFIIB domain-containing protein [Deltaproteobacteria bacterium]